MDRAKKIYTRKSQGFKIIVFLIIIFTAVQLWFLYSRYKELVIKIPEDLFTSPSPFPQAELIVNASYKDLLNGDLLNTGTGTEQQGTESLENTLETAETTIDTTEDMTVTVTEFELTDVQKKIVLGAMDLLDKNIEYGYQVYPETGYPQENIWISTDVISMILNDAGFDLMELIYDDMVAHKEDYPLDIKNRNDPIKYIDFRDVFFQEQFFKRNALELDTKFIPGNEENLIQWQPGDIIYFQFDPDNPYQDLGGFISSHTNDQGVPLVIMISKEFGKVSEVDKLQEYTVIAHFRYPNPYEE